MDRQRCSDSSSTHEDDGEYNKFVCRDRGYEANADYNGPKNIAVRYCEYIYRWQKSHGGWAPSQLDLKVGTVNQNDEYTLFLLLE